MGEFPGELLVKNRVRAQELKEAMNIQPSVLKLIPAKLAVKHKAVPLDVPTNFKLVNNTNSHYLGGLAKTRENILLLKLLGKQIPKTVFLMPIFAGGRTVYILYGDNGHGGFASTDIGELLIIVQRIPDAIDNLILKVKKVYQLA